MMRVVCLEMTAKNRRSDAADVRIDIERTTTGRSSFSSSVIRDIFWKQIRHLF
jgi:hypothetical protein